ncbi:hypothetical protein XarjCFBP1022_10380 [Xanthomonas arboricola]|nr:hypothetical protein XarjCFBP1022_10380 [Xanthomonas arboricola]
MRPWSLPGGIHAAKGPATGKDTAPGSWSAAFLKACCSACDGRLLNVQSEQRASSTALTVHTDHLHWSLPAHRRGTLRGMDAA